MSVASRLASLATNNIIGLADIKRINYPLYKYVKKHYSTVYLDLRNIGICLVNTDRIGYNLDRQQLIAVIWYLYGDYVNISKFKKERFYLFNLMIKVKTECSVRKFLVSAGFKVTNDYIEKVDKKYKEKLKPYVNNGIIIGLTANVYLYNQVSKRASSLGMTVKEYINKLGYITREDKIKKLRRRGFSYSQIAKEMGMTKNGVYLKFKRWKEKEIR